MLHGFNPHHRVAGKLPKPSDMLSQCSKELEKIIIKATLPDPKQRYQNIAEMVEDLENIGRQTKPVSPTFPWPNRFEFPNCFGFQDSSSLGILGVALILLSLALLLSQSNPEAEVLPEKAESSPTETTAEEALPLKPTDIVHTVQYHGEALSIIADWYTGELENWTELAQHNPSIDANKLELGEKIKVPYSLVINANPFKQAHIQHVRNRLKPQIPETPELVLGNSKV